MNRFWRSTWVVCVKECTDALRDRRTLLTVLLSTVAMGPLALVLMSVLVSDQEQRASARQLLASGLEHAPTLRDHFVRQGYAPLPPPPQAEQRLAQGRLADAVLVLPADFEARLAGGEQPEVLLLSSSANAASEAAAQRLRALLYSFNQEQARVQLAVRGVSLGLLQPLRLEEHDLADPASRAARLMGMLPFFMLMAMLYGAMNAALDSTAGERERGSLAPLLMTPVPRSALVLGKWAAVSAVAMLIALVSCLSFLPGRWLLRSDQLAALFRYGPAEALAFLALLLPLAGALSAVLMLLAVGCRTLKEAQSRAAVLVMGVSLLPVVALLSPEGERPWHHAVPVLAQFTLMGRVLKGEALGAWEVLAPAGLCAVLTGLCWLALTRWLQRGPG